MAYSKEKKKNYNKLYYKNNKEKHIEYRKKNKEYIRKKYLEYYSKNKERIKEYQKSYQKKYGKIYKEKNRVKNLLYLKEYKQINREKVRNYQNAYARNRNKIDINFRLKNRLVSRLYIAIKNNKKNGSAVKDLGCSIEYLKEYLENQFKDGMSWDNWAINGWHIDHIIPLASFDLTDRKQIKIALNYKNLQPLWANENRVKSNKILEDNK